MTYTSSDVVFACAVWGVLGLMTGILLTALYSHSHNRPKRDSRGRFVKG